MRMKLYTADIVASIVENNDGVTNIVKTTILPISSQTEPVYKLTLHISTCNKSKIYGKSHYRKEMSSKRNLKISTICEYLNSKIEHCKLSERKNKDTLSVELSCNFEWLVSVVETEFDYHIGNRNCTKKENEKYMNEYTATQLSGFGERFYDAKNNISLSSIAKLYPMNVKKKKTPAGSKKKPRGAKAVGTQID